MSKTTFGGGAISPAVAAHLKKVVAPVMKKAAAEVAVVQFGGGAISPLVAAHLAKRNIAKK